MPFGGGPFGTATADTLGLTGAVRALTANQVVVEFTGEIGLPNPTNPDSPLNPSNWVLVALDPNAVVRLVQDVQLVDETTLPTLLDQVPQLVSVALPAFLVSFDGVLTEGAPYRLELVTEDTELSGCGCAEFVALVLEREARQTDERDSDGVLRDIANPPVARDALRFPPRLGTYQVTETGDLGLDKSSASGLRKRILRRITTATGEFFHLPDYGVAPGLKKLVTLDSLQRLQARITAQVLREPEVAQVQVSVVRVPGFPEVVSVNVRAKTQDGQDVGVVVQVPAR
jgi:hypothetical protein